MGETIGVIATLRRRTVQQCAGNIGDVIIIVIHILHLVQTALPTAIAQAFPFDAVHIRKRFGLPKGLVRQRHEAVSIRCRKEPHTFPIDKPTAAAFSPKASCIWNKGWAAPSYWVVA